MPERFEFQISANYYRKRLDEFLFAEFPHLSRMYLRELVRDAKCEVNGRWENRGYLLKVNDFIEVEVDRARSTSLQPEPLPLEILFEDEEILVVDKPSGMLVHPTVRVRTGTLLNALAFHLNAKKPGNETESRTEEIEDLSNSRFGRLSALLAAHPAQTFIRAGLIHRLDKDTSGLMVIAKSPRAHRIVCAHFQRKKIEKRYFALVEGIVEQDAGTIDAPVGRYEEVRLWDIKPDGKTAVTNFWVRERRADSTLIELEPVTGRTNQLRIHLAHLGHPIIGDVKYGGRISNRLCLHAFRLCFHHPNGSRYLEFETEIPVSIKNSSL